MRNAPLLAVFVTSAANRGGWNSFVWRTRQEL